ncbi:MAG: endonuclease III [Acidimicrobiaceae bacterium]|jgi:endonuclease-3|nr:endonuclease III [Acidimicrobiaceae bacterium]HAY51003.1 endonuclease III [Acidimicrobiaceae bacterium]|tara:strand:- start:1420 stop:2064 length:645 start_codon:yes stop_codon:yes gene_type:complete
MARPRTPKGRCLRTHEELKTEYPDAECELDYKNAFQLLAATILSAQATDVSVNKATPDLFKRFPNPEELSVANVEEVETYINSIGLFRGKAKNLVGMAQRLVEEFDGQVPESMGDLVSLPGVGRKTANVVRSVALGLPGLPVDTHVGRLARRLAITEENDPVKIELALNPMLPAQERGEFSLRVILHGRRVCFARKPNCNECALNYFCPSAFTL